MPKKVLKPRRRLIAFRVSSDEFEALRAACARTEARNLTEFMRSAALGAAVRRKSEGEALEDQVHNLGSLLNELESRIEKLAQVSEGMGR